MLSDYLSCAERKISTITLIGAGIGVIVGVFAIALGCIWLTRKNRRKGPPDSDGNDDEEESSKQTMKQDMEKGQTRKLESISDGEDMTPVKLKEDDPPVMQEPQRINKTTSRMLTGRTDSSASEGGILSKIGPTNSSRIGMHSQHHSRPAVSHFSTSSRSQPLISDTVGSRNIFPSNPLPSPRHLQMRNEQTPKRASAMSTKGLQPLPLAMKRTTRSIALQGVTNNVSRPGSVASFVQRTTGMTETIVPPVSMLSQCAPSSPTTIHCRSTPTRSESDTSCPLQVPLSMAPSSSSVPSNPNATAPLKIRKSAVQIARRPSYHPPMNFRPTLQASMAPSKINDNASRSIDLSGSRAFDRPGNGPKAIQTRTKKDSVDYMRLNSGSIVSKRTSTGSNSTNLRPLPFISSSRNKVVPESDGRSESQKSERLTLQEDGCTRRVE